MIDFGNVGLWAYANDQFWIQLHTANPEALAAGPLNAPRVRIG